MGKVGHIKDLTPDPHNRRTHTPRNLGMLIDALQAVGAARSIVIDEGGQVLAGNGVLQAAAEAGITRLQVVESDGDTLVAVRRRGLSEEQKRALAIYDNRVAELAEWNVEQLQLDAAAGLDLKPFFTDQELSDVLGGSLKPGRTDPDAVPEVRATDIRRGDLFALGAHRLLCGDATDARDVARLMGKKRADLVFTSPPYGQQRDYGAQIGDWDALMRGTFALLPCDDEAQVLVNLGLIHRDGEWIPYWDGWIAWMREHRWRRFGWYVWDQGFGLPGDWNGRLAPSHEFVFHFNRVAERARKTKDKQPENVKSRTDGASTMRGKDGKTRKFSSPEASAQPRKIPDSVIRINRQVGRISDELDHPAVFPVELAVEILGAFSDHGEMAYEPFAGSGTTLIAAEQLGRACRALEIEPQYCQVAIDRWEAFTGQTAVKMDACAALGLSRPR